MFVLWDKYIKIIVNNELVDIICIFNYWFNVLIGNEDDYYFE